MVFLSPFFKFLWKSFCKFTVIMVFEKKLDFVKFVEAYRLKKNVLRRNKYILLALSPACQSVYKFVTLEAAHNYKFTLICEDGESAHSKHP